MIGMGSTYHDPADDLKKGVQIVEQYFQSLESHDLSADLNRKVRNSHDGWRRIHTLITQSPTKANAVTLLEMVETFTVDCMRISEAIANETKKRGNNYVVWLAQLSMESQRLTALYVLKAWGVVHRDYGARVNEIMSEYHELYKKLVTADDKYVSPHVKRELQNVDDQYMMFRVMVNSKSGRFAPSLAEKSASNIFGMIKALLKEEQHWLQSKSK